LENLIPLVVTGPTFEPVTIYQAKKQCEIAESDVAHDEHLTDLIVSAREELEQDTGICFATRTLKTYMESIEDGTRLQTRPVTSITSLKYYDTTNTQQTLATTYYGFDIGKRQIRLKYNQSWPVYTPRWDAWEITYVCGYASEALIPQLAKAAILMLVGYRFENRDMIHSDAMNNCKPYEALVAKMMRATYP